MQIGVQKAYKIFLKMETHLVVSPSLCRCAHCPMWWMMGYEFLTACLAAWTCNFCSSLYFCSAAFLASIISSRSYKIMFMYQTHFAKIFTNCQVTKLHLNECIWENLCNRCTIWVLSNRCAIWILSNRWEIWISSNRSAIWILSNRWTIGFWETDENWVLRNRLWQFDEIFWQNITKKSRLFLFLKVHQKLWYDAGP